jgi:DNA-binding transcriptional LysR family regulator
MLDLVELAIFVRAVEGRSLTAAANALQLPRSTVTRRLAQLEDTLGVQLLQRSTRSMSLTAAGEAFFPRAARLVSDAEAAVADIRQAQAEPRGRLRVTAPVEFGDGFLFELCVEFLKQYPEVTLEMDLSNRIVDLVAEGFDVAIRAGRLADSTLIARKLTPAVFRVYASEKYLANHPMPSHPSELVRHTLIHMGRGPGPFEWSLQNRRDDVTIPVLPRLIVSHFQAVREAVAGGVGIGFMPTFFGDRDVANGCMLPILDGWTGDGASVHAVTPANRHPRPAVQRFIEMVQQRLRETVEAR